MTLEWQFGNGATAPRGGHSVAWWESATLGTYLVLGGIGGAATGVAAYAAW